jgi:hypothetical protein
MLQRSNFKVRACGFPRFYAPFTLEMDFAGPKRAPRVPAKMGYPANTGTLRSLLTAASGLRKLADDRLVAHGDKRLYLLAAAALEARARRMASSLPGEEDGYDPATDAALHRPVDLLI